MGSLANQVNKTVEVKGNGLNMDVGLVQNKTTGEIIESTRPKSVPKLLSPFTIRDQTFPNRILVNFNVNFRPDNSTYANVE